MPIRGSGDRPGPVEVGPGRGGVIRLPCRLPAGLKGQGLERLEEGQEAGGKKQGQVAGGQEAWAKWREQVAQGGQVAGGKRRRQESGGKWRGASGGG